MNAIEQFIQQTQAYHRVDVVKAFDLMQAQQGDILFVGRASCGFCRRFSNKLTDLLNQTDLRIHFLDTDNMMEDQQLLADFRSKYGVITVPGFLISKPEGVQVRCDSSMSMEEIFRFIS